MRFTAASLIALVASAASFCSAASLPSSRLHSGFFARDDDDGNPAENHDPEVLAPEGAVIKDVSVSTGSTNSRILTYWTKFPKDEAARNAYVIIHGRFRDGDLYWTTMNNALKSAVKDYRKGDGKPDENAIIVAPEFFSAKLNSGRFKGTQMAWGSGDDLDWEGGGVATKPDRNTASSFDVLDAIIAQFANKTQYPNMRNVSLVGHGGRSTPAGLWVRYIHGDASTCAYFTKDRPDTSSVTNYTKSDCLRTYNSWKFGFKDYVGPEALTARQYFKRYITRDVVFMIGKEDTKANGDQGCEAQLQGGPRRRDRNMSWYKYITALAGTGENVSRLTGDFDYDALPDWSSDNQKTSALRLVLVPGADHNASEVFASKQGRGALFNTTLYSWRNDA